MMFLHPRWEIHAYGYMGSDLGMPIACWTLRGAKREMRRAQKMIVCNGYDYTVGIERRKTTQ
jgi:hypothetical protein